MGLLLPFFSHPFLEVRRAARRAAQVYAWPFEVLARAALVTSGLGAVLDGTALQRWYALLHSRLPGQGAAVLMQRLLVHQTAFAPLLIPAFVAATVILEGRSEPWQQVVRQVWRPALCAHWLLVAPSQVANAWLVPKPYQVLWANTCALAWATALSRLTTLSSGSTLS